MKWAVNIMVFSCYRLDKEGTLIRF